MPVEIADVINVITPILKSAGFGHRNKRNWYIIYDEVIQRLHLEKSSFSNKNWLTCYLTLPRMDAGGTPEFGITLYIDQLLPNKELLARALDQDERSMQNRERAEAIRTSLELYVLPVLRALTTENGVKDFYQTKKSRREFSMNAKTAKFLGLWEFYEAENREMEKRQAEYVTQQAQKVHCKPP